VLTAFYPQKYKFITKGSLWKNGCVIHLQMTWVFCIPFILLLSSDCFEMYTLFNKNQAAWNFLRPVPEVTLPTVAIIIRVVVHTFSLKRNSVSDIWHIVRLDMYILSPIRDSRFLKYVAKRQNWHVRIFTNKILFSSAITLSIVSYQSLSVTWLFIWSSLYLLYLYTLQAVFVLMQDSETFNP